MNKYIGHPAQISGVEEVILAKGKGKGMTLLQVRNGLGLELVLSADRAMDIARVTFKGDNLGYFSPCGYVAPDFYDNRGNGFLKSFTAGFLTTCGLTAVGSPCIDNGEELPLHGTIANTPCENFSYEETESEITVKAQVRDAALFAHQLLLKREYTVSKTENTVLLCDRIQNIGSSKAPLEVLYHCNIGYPLLSENTVLEIPASATEPRNDHAREGLSACFQMEKPGRGYEEMCYYHTLSEGKVSAYNPDIKKRVAISFDTAELPYFVEWKMMGEHDYVLGLEPGNCLPDGRDVMRQKGVLAFLEPEEEKQHHIAFCFTEE